MGQPQHEHLTIAESESLQNKALRQQAKTIETFLSITALTGTPDADIQRGIDRIRELDKPTARRYGKQLLHTLQVFSDLLPQELNSDESIVEPEQSSEPTQLGEPIETPIEDKSNDQLVEKSSPLSEEEIDTIEEPVQTLPPRGHKWAKMLLGSEVDLDKYTIYEIAEMIYDKAGRPVSRKKGPSGRVEVDPIQRIVGRLKGMNNRVVAQNEGSNEAAVSFWISTKIITPIRKMGSEESQPDTETPELAILPAIDTQGKVEDSEDNNEISALDDENSAAFEGLINANFTREEAVALLECFEFEGGSAKVRRDEATVALNKLQTLLVRQAGNIDDHPALPGLRMLSNPIFGNKTVFDVYFSMHKRDTQITQDSVTEILRDGTAILVNGKEHDS